jgi:hypothetical protein
MLQEKVFPPPPSLNISLTLKPTFSQIRKRFELSGPFAILWQDDEKEVYAIQDEVSLSLAIEFYQSGDEGSVASSGSILSRSSSRHPKITMEVEISVDYDGPSLSETSSVAGRDEGSPEGSQLSFLPGDLSGFPQDDDAVTVSSKDTRGTKGKGRADSSLIKKIWNGTSRSAGGSSLSMLPLKPSRSRIFNLASRGPSTEEGTSAGSVRIRHNGRSTDSLTDTEKPYLDDSAVFERLRLEDRSTLETERRKAWLQQQDTLRKAMLGVVPSLSDDSISLNTDSPLSEGISIERDNRGKLYYNLTSIGTSESSGDLEYEDVIQPSK